MSQRYSAWRIGSPSRLRHKLNQALLGALVGYWIVAGWVGTLTLTHYVVISHFVNVERVIFAARLRHAYQTGWEVSVCPGECFTDGLSTYRGLQITVIPQPARVDATQS